MTTAEQQVLLQDSFALIYQNKARIGSVCFENLTSRCPAASALFGKGFSSHNLMLVVELALILRAQTHDTPSVQTQRLSRFHASAGVQAKHFPAMRIALLDAISTVLGQEFTPELRDAWGAAFDHLAQQMITGT